MTEHDDDPLAPGALPPGDPAPRPVRATTPGRPPLVDRMPTLPDMPPLEPRQERAYAAIAHLSQLAGIVVGPVMVLGSVGRQSLFVDRHATEAFNFQATFVLLFLASAVVALRGAGPTALAVVAGYGAVMAGFAALRTWQGAYFHYPLAIRFLK